MRYHQKFLPSPNDIVFVSPVSFSENGVYCKLLEYDGIEGLILSTEIVRKWTDSKNNQKTFKYDHVYPVLVMEADDKHIDLSYRKIAPDERDGYVLNFEKFKKIVQLVDELVWAENLNEENMYEQYVWPAMSGDHFLLYNNILKNPDSLVDMYLGDEREKIQRFADNLRKRVTKTDIIMSRDFQLYVFETDGINKLKTILSSNFGPDSKIEIRYVCSPRYQIIVSGQDEERINTMIEEAMKVLENNAIPFKNSLTFDENNVVVKKMECSLKPLNMRGGENE